jgi:hypothetical protein
LLHGKIGRLGASQYPRHEVRGATAHIGEGGAPYDMSPPFFM